MVKHSSGDIHLEKYKMLKRLYSPSSSLSFVVHPDDGDQSRFFTPSSASSNVSVSFIYGRYLVYNRIFPQAAPMTSDAVSPHFFQWIHFYFNFLLPFSTPGRVVPFCSLLILAIAQCSYTGELLYHLCANVKYTTFTRSFWSLMTAL